MVVGEEHLPDGGLLGGGERCGMRRREKEREAGEVGPPDSFSRVRWSRAGRVAGRVGVMMQCHCAIVRAFSKDLESLMNMKEDLITRRGTGFGGEASARGVAAGGMGMWLFGKSERDLTPAFAISRGIRRIRHRSSGFGWRRDPKDGTIWRLVFTVCNSTSAALSAPRAWRMWANAFARAAADHAHQPQPTNASVY